MEQTYKNKRYIVDPLYGVIHLFDFIWEVITSPELQRLREVRLCNINSLCLTGGANINRYEHAIGTYYLAQECLKSWPPLTNINEKEQRHFLLAALLHDITSAAFGHSVEYIESKDGFNHEKAFEYAVLGEDSECYQYKDATLEPIFFGLQRELSSRIEHAALREISEIICGKGKFGPLINSDIDLDNIDNVFRLAYHIGLVKSGDIPLRLAKSIWIKNDEVVVKNEAIPLIEEWYKVRRMLYELLLLNPEEFSAKCMLSEAIELAKVKSRRLFTWKDVDYDLLKKLSQVSSEVETIIKRLMKGDLYGCIGIYSSKKTEQYETFIDAKKKLKMEENLDNRLRALALPQLKSANIAFHPIIDKNKIERQVRIRTEDGNIRQIGRASNQLLIGVFFKNVDLSMQRLANSYKDDKILKEVFAFLSNNLGDTNLEVMELYAEAEKYKDK